MKIETTRVQGGFGMVAGKSFVMFGNRPDTGKWFERYYPTVEAAVKFAEKRGWPVTVTATVTG